MNIQVALRIAARVLKKEHELVTEGHAEALKFSSEQIQDAYNCLAEFHATIKE